MIHYGLLYLVMVFGVTDMCRLGRFSAQSTELSRHQAYGFSRMIDRVGTV
jgi:hypothetical protein